MCRCGCRGWCSIFPLLDAWVQDFEELQNKLEVAVIDIQCDWPAFLEVSGGRFWGHRQHPCPLCNMNQASLNADNLQAITLDNLGFDLYSDDDYAQDIRNFTKAG